MVEGERSMKLNLPHCQGFPKEYVLEDLKILEGSKLFLENNARYLPMFIESWGF